MPPAGFLVEAIVVFLIQQWHEYEAKKDVDLKFRRSTYMYASYLWEAPSPLSAKQRLALLGKYLAYSFRAQAWVRIHTIINIIFSNALPS